MQKERTIMLTEKEAWLKIANFFKYCRSTYITYNDAEEKGYGFRSHKSRVIGICDYLSILKINNIISDIIRTDMLVKIQKHPEYKGRFDYIWPATKEGHKQRIKFCLERAAEL
jgi:hypothetical protein